MCVVGLWCFVVFVLCWVKVIMLACCYCLILWRKVCLTRSRKKQARRKRFLKRMRIQGKWTHGVSKIKKVRRREAARALLANKPREVGFG